MYVLKVDGEPFYAPALYDEKCRVLNPRLKQEVNTAGSLSFVLPPGHFMHDTIKKLKNVITVEQDGIEIFQGRVSEEYIDTYNQKECYCEGDLSYLKDSMQRPYEYNGDAKAYFRKLIDEHNKQVETKKRFTVGQLTALADDDVVKTESVDYKDTLSEIKYILVNAYGGYLRTRYEGGVRYIDYIKEYDGECAQEIRFGINLLDLDNQIDTKEIGTVLIPLGKMKKSKALTIESVNNGKDYIESEEGIAQYGRVWKTYTWNDEDDPAELLKKGKKKLKKMASIETITMKAIDLRLFGANVDRIQCGSKVRLVSSLHGLDREEVCISADIDMENPDESTYTFGKLPETMSGGMKDNADALGGYGGGVKKLESHYNKTVEHIDEIDETLTTVMLDMDAVDAELKLMVKKGELISAINMSPESIKISSAKIELDGDTIVSKLYGRTITVSHVDTYGIEASEGSFSVLDASSAEISTLNCGSLVLDGDDVSWKSETVQTGLPNFATAVVTLVNGGSLRVVTGWEKPITDYQSKLNYLGK